MASQAQEIDLSKLDEFFEVGKGPSFKDLMNAAFFDSKQLLEFRFKDDRRPIIGKLTGYVPGGEQFCLVAVQHHAGRGGSAEIAYFFYSPVRRLGKRIYPKSLKQLLDYHEKGESLNLDDLAREVEQLNYLLKQKNRKPHLPAWQDHFNSALTKLNDLSAQSLSRA